VFGLDPAFPVIRRGVSNISRVPSTGCGLSASRSVSSRGRCC